VAAGLAASAASSAAQAAGGGEIAQELAGVIGPHAASDIGQLSRKGLAQLMKTVITSRKSPDYESKAIFFRLDQIG